MIRLIKFILVASVFVLCGSIQAEENHKVFMIGNSLTWGSLPNELGLDVNYHVQTNNNLHQIHTTPFINGPGSIMWQEALVNNQYDVLILQVYRGSTLVQDFEAIKTFADMQPNADIIIFTGWPMHTIFEERFYASPENLTGQSLTYIYALEGAVSAEYPDRNVFVTEHLRVLEKIRLDSASGSGHFDELADLFRDETHLSYIEGRYLSHNLIRKSLGLPISTPEGFEVSKLTKFYLDCVIQDSGCSTSWISFVVSGG